MWTTIQRSHGQEEKHYSVTKTTKWYKNNLAVRKGRQGLQGIVQPDSCKNDLTGNLQYSL
jgi:hypothetical protein